MTHHRSGSSAAPQVQSILVIMLFTSLVLAGSAAAFTPCTGIDPAEHDIYFHDDFENGQGNWSITAGTWQVGIPLSGIGVNSGFNCAGTDLDAFYPQAVNSMIYTEEIPLPADPPDGVIYLQYWQWFTFAWDEDLGRVRISVDGEPSIPIDATLYRQSRRWSPRIIDLSQYAGSTIRIFFQIYDPAVYPYGEDYGWYIDDVTVFGGRFPVRTLEDFENKTPDPCWRGWSADMGVWQIGTPTNAEWGPDPHDGRFCAGTYLNGNYRTGSNSRLVSPLLDIPADPMGGDVWLEFWHWFNFAGDGDYGRVEIWTADVGWEVVSPSFWNYGGLWSPCQVDLSPYMGQSIRVGFHMVDDWNYPDAQAHGWYIDDVAIVEGPVFFNNPSSFTAGAPGWGTTRGAWEVGEPTSGPEECHSPPYCWGTRMGGNYVQAMNSLLLSPWIDLLAEPDESMFLKFWHWFSFAGDGDYGNVYIQLGSEDEDWIQIAGSFLNSSDWTQHSVSLDDWAGQRVRFGFRAVDTNVYPYAESHGWFIDDVEITGMPQSEPVANMQPFIQVHYSIDAPVIQWFYTPFDPEYVAVYATYVGDGSEDALLTHLPSLASRVALLPGDTMSFTDLDRPCYRYFYRLALVDSLGHEAPSAYTWPVAVPDDGGPVPSPARVQSLGNHPNPFNPQTDIIFALGRPSHIKLEIYDLQGHKLKTLVNEHLDAGEHTVSFAATRLASGVYFCKLTAGGETRTSKMMILK